MQNVEKSGWTLRMRGKTGVRTTKSAYDARKTKRRNDALRLRYFNSEDISEIQDSGDRTEFETGAVRDMHEGKGRFDLLPWEAIWEVAKHCEEGAKKYGERNCEKGIPIHSLLDSGMRHLAKYMMGFKDEPHLRAAAWNILYALYMEEKHPEMQDIPTRKENKE